MSAKPALGGIDFTRPDGTTLRCTVEIAELGDYTARLLSRGRVITGIRPANRAELARHNVIGTQAAGQ